LHIAYDNIEKKIIILKNNIVVKTYMNKKLGYCDKSFTPSNVNSCIVTFSITIGHPNPNDVVLFEFIIV
jgi:hypothetical protein